MTPGPSRRVHLDSLLSTLPSALTAQFVPAHELAVSDVALVTEVDQILSVGPGSVVLLGQDLAVGGWVVSVALRYAWERHAVALIVSDQLLSESVVGLARRFGVALFTTEGEADHMALALALSRGLGALEAGMLARLNTLQERMARARTVAEVLEMLSHHLGGACIEVVINDEVAHYSGTARADAVKVRQPLSPGPSGRHLIASVPRQEQEFTEGALARAAAPVLSLLLSDELRDLRETAPLLSFAALVDLDLEHASAQLALEPSGRPRAAIVLRLAQGNTDVVDALGPVVSARWHARFRRTPLARTALGWFAVVPLQDSPTSVEELSRRVSGLRLADLGVAVGIGADPIGEMGTDVLLRRARLAARVAGPADGALPFHRLAPAMLSRVLTQAEAGEIARAALPALFADPQADDLIAAVVAYLDCAGSVSTAADRLDLHRNTIQLRLRRAAELGVPLADPERLLGVHLVFAALVRGSNPT